MGFLLLCLRLLFASRKCKTFFRSSFLRNYRSFSHFCSAEAASAAAVSRKAIFAQNPWQRRGFLALMPAPAFRVAKMLDVHSLLVPAELSLILSFLLRGRRLPPPFIFRKAIFAQNPWQRRGFLALMPAPAFRVAKMQDVHSLPKKSIIHTELHRIGSDRPTYPAIIPTVLTNRLFYACSHFDYKLCCLHPIILVSNNYLICLCSKEIPPLLFFFEKISAKD